jgi:tetratricopeptide (TPR) repeat protein
LATAVNPRQGAAFTGEVIDELQGQLPRSLYFLCQVYLSEGRFDAAYVLAKQQNRYNNLETIKLVAKAHLLAGLGPKAAPGMGAYLQDLYAKVERAGKEPMLFLRDYLPSMPTIDKKTAVSHAEALYRNVMQLHIDNGRKTYATAAYYCALLGEIAAYDGRAAEFKQFYQELLDRYPRHRALRQELAAKVKI